MVKINTQVCLIAFALLLGIFLIGFASAAINVSIGSSGLVVDNSTNRGSGTNYSLGLHGTLILNVTFLNLTDGVTVFGDISTTSINATFYRVSGATTTLIANSSICALQTAAAANGVISCWTNISIPTSASDGLYNITAQLMNTTKNTINATVNATHVYFDSTAPQVSSLLASGTNHSVKSNGGNLILNATITETSYGDTVIFTVFNNTIGGINSTNLASREGTSSRWSVAINTSHYPNGKYNVSVFMNDTIGNSNTTLNTTSLPLMSNLIFDNTAPSISFSCTPATVNTGSTVTCSCSGGATSGINDTSPVTESPSTSDTGTHIRTCSVTSRSGLSTSTTAQYTVNLASSGGGSSSSGGSSSTTTWTKTIPNNNVELSEKGPVTQSLGSKERVSVKVSGGTHHVGVKSITSSSATIEVASTPREVTLAVGESGKFEVSDDNFYDLKVTLNSIVNNKADITVLSISEEIPAEKVEEAIGGGDEVSDSGADVVRTSPTSSGGWIWLIIGVVVVIILAILGVIYYKKKKY